MFGDQGGRQRDLTTSDDERLASGSLETETSHASE
jgi:hypothetical protein